MVSDGNLTFFFFEKRRIQLKGALFEGADTLSQFLDGFLGVNRTRYERMSTFKEATSFTAPNDGLGGGASSCVRLREGVSFA